MKRPVLMVLILNVLSVAQTIRATSPELAAADFIRRTRAECAALLKRDPATLEVPTDPNKQFVYVLNGKKFTAKDLARGIAGTYAESCSTDDIQVTFSGGFPAKAIVNFRRQHEGTYAITGKKHKVFSVYARATYEYRDNEWLLRKLEAASEN